LDGRASVAASSTVAEALKVLEWAGVLTWQHRIVRIREHCIGRTAEGFEPSVALFDLPICILVVGILPKYGKRPARPGEP
jgi:hypothetical protein